MKKMRKALTTAELMIALTIIGIISTLILPGYIENYHKKIYITKLKKTYYTLSNAIEQACIDSNVSSFYQSGYTNTDKTKDFLEKYMKVKTQIGSNKFGFNLSYKDIANGQDRETIFLTDFYTILNDGQAIAIDCSNTPNPALCYVYLDVNATDGPNISGRDMFTFGIDTKNNKIIDPFDPRKCEEDSNVKTIRNKINGSTYKVGVYGGGCLGRIMNDNWNMNY